MLSDTAIKNAKPCLKPDKGGGNPIHVDGDYKMHDSAGLYLWVKKNGGKWWRVDYRFDGKRQTLSVGVYPDTSLREARLNRDKIRDAVKAGINPSIQRKAEAIRSDSGDTFEKVAREWHGKKSATWSEGHAKRTIERLERDVFPFIGSMPIADIDAPTLLAVLQRMEARGISDSVLRVRENCGAVFRYGVATGRCNDCSPPHVAPVFSPYSRPL